MNKRQRQHIQNENLKNLEVNRFGSFKNHIRINIGNTYDHEKAKFDECWKLKKQGFDFFTEADLVGGGRCDIIDIDNGEVIEILHTETDEQAREKTKKYPSGLFIRYVRTGEE